MTNSSLTCPHCICCTCAGATGVTGKQGPTGPIGPSGHVVLPKGLVYKIAALMVIAVLLVSTGMTLWISNSGVSSVEKKLAESNKVLCLRSQEFSPALGVFYAENHVFSVEVQQKYFATIPKSCP
jgi:hypothetical protein